MISEDKIKERMNRLGIKEEDLKESFVCASGPGGQNVNKVATCVLLVHLPTNTQVKCQTERSQYQNRMGAREMLLNKVEGERQHKAQQTKSIQEKAKRQNRKKPKALKERILKVKKFKSEKKKERKKISSYGYDE